MTRLVARRLLAAVAVSAVFLGATTATAGATGDSTLQGYFMATPAGWGPAPGVLMNLALTEEQTLLGKAGVSRVAITGWVAPSGNENLLDLLFVLPPTASVGPLDSLLTGVCSSDAGTAAALTSLSGIPGGEEGTCTGRGNSVDAAVFERADVVTLLVLTARGVPASGIAADAGAQYALLPADGVAGGSHALVVVVGAIAVVGVAVVAALGVRHARRTRARALTWPGYGEGWSPAPGPPGSAAATGWPPPGAASGGAPGAGSAPGPAPAEHAPLPSFFGGPAPAPPAPTAAPAAPAGQWVEVPGDPTLRCYWDGTGYTATVRWNGTAWESVEGSPGAAATPT